jgi:hypothetical protein
MGLFGALGKIIAGKPIYSPEASSSTSGATPSNPLGQQADVPPSLPVVRIGRVENRRSSGRIDIYADLHNESNDAIFIDYALLMGVKRELNFQLRAGEARQLLLYSGQPLQVQPTGYAELAYRRQSDRDYFADYHQIRSRRTEQGYEITELLLQGPVKDVR